MKSYVSKIQILERELLRLKSPKSMSSSHLVECADYDDDEYGLKDALFNHGDEFPSDCNAKAGELPGNTLENLI